MRIQFILIVLLLVMFGSPCYSQDTLKVDVGGALRLNYNMSSWKKEQVKRGGDFGYDLFRVNVKGTYGKLGFNAEYRLYSEVYVFKPKWN